MISWTSLFSVVNFVLSIVVGVVLIVDFFYNRFQFFFAKHFGLFDFILRFVQFVIVFFNITLVVPSHVMLIACDSKINHKKQRIGVFGSVFETRETNL